MVNFLKQPGGNRLSQSSGNRTSDLLRQHLAESAAQRISSAYANRDQQVQPEPELIEPSFFRNMTPAIGKLVEHATGQEIEKRQQARDIEAQQSATEELANIYAAELDIPLERARLIASAPPEARKQVIKDIIDQRKEERGFEKATALEEIKQENRTKLVDYKKQADAKFPKDDPNRQWYQQGLVATENLRKLAKTIKHDPQGYFNKIGYKRKDEEKVKNWLTMAMASATPIAHLSEAQRKDLEARYLDQFYTKGLTDEVINQLTNTFNPQNFESIQERSQMMAQQREQGAQQPIEGQAQLEQPAQTNQEMQPQEPGEPSLLGEVGDIAARGVLRAQANIIERMDTALKYGPHMLPWTASLHVAEFVKPYLPQFAQKAVELNRQLYNMIQPPTIQDLKDKYPELGLDKVLEPQGTVDRIIDSATNEIPEMAIAWGTGGGVVKPLVQGLLGGLSDEWLEAQEAPELVKVGARLLTSLGTSGGIEALKSLSQGKTPTAALSKVVRNKSSKDYEGAKKLAKGVIVDAQPIKEMQATLNKPGASNAISDKTGFNSLKSTLGSFFEHTPEPMKTPNIEAPPATDFFESFGKRVSPETTIKFTPRQKEISSVQVNLPDLFKGYKDLGKLESKETDKDLKRFISLAKDSVWNTIQQASDLSPKAAESVSMWNAANAGWAATEKLTGLEKIVKNVAEKHPGISRSVVLGAIPAFLGFGHLVGPSKALLLGGSAAAVGGYGSLKRQLSYLKRPEVQKLFMEFLESGLANDVSQTSRNYRDIVNGFKKATRSKQS